MNNKGFKKVLYALREREKWHSLYTQFKDQLEELPPRLRRERKVELRKIMQHIKYYDQLIRDMKFSLSPPSIWHVNALFR